VRSWSSFVVVVSVTVLLGTWAAAADPQGTVVVARAEGDALVLWDASPVVADIVTNKEPRDEAMRKLEAQSIDVLASKAAVLKQTQTIAVRVIYAKTGAVSPVYHAATFASIEKVFTVTAATPKIASESAAWAKQLGAGKIPNDLSVTITGELPPL
jgi:hypothetical protein